MNCDWSSIPTSEHLLNIYGMDALESAKRPEPLQTSWVSHIWLEKIIFQVEPWHPEQSYL